MACYGAFYTANWEEHFLGVLQTNFQGFGVTELLVFQIIIVGLHGFTDISRFTIRELGSAVFPNMSLNDVQRMAS